VSSRPTRGNAAGADLNASPVNSIVDQAVSITAGDPSPINSLGAESFSTRRVYAIALGNFEAWCKQNAQSSFPASPEAVASWLTARSHAGASRSTLSVSLAAIKWSHPEAGIRFDDTDPTFQKVWKALRSPHAARQAQKQAGALHAALLSELLDGVDNRSRSIVDRRDAAMLGLLYAFGLGRSELSDLDWETRGDGSPILHMDGSELTIEFAKPGASRSARASIPVGCCPRIVRAVGKWIGIGKIAPGMPVCRRLTPKRTRATGRLLPDAIDHRIKIAMERHFIRSGLSPSIARHKAIGFSGHSGRAGLIETAKRGASKADIVALTRHRMSVMVTLYGDEAGQVLRRIHGVPGVGV